MIELQNVWNEIEDQLDELDDQDVVFPERQARSPQKLGLDDFAYEAKLAISHAGGSLLSNERPPSADDNLLAQFLGDYAYELDRTREDEDSDASSVGSPLQDLPSSSLFEDLLLSHPTTSNNVVRKESVAVPTFDYITQEPPVKGKSGLVVPASPSTPITPHGIEDSSSPSPSKKRSSSEDDTSAKKRHCAPTIPTPVAAPTPTSTKRTYLLHLISNVLPAEKLAGVVEIVNETSYVQRVESEEEIELEFDINALDEVTLKRLEQYVESCLSFTRPKRTTSKAKRKESHGHSHSHNHGHSKRSGSRKRELRMSLESMGEVLTMKHGSLSDDESEDIDILG